MALYGDPKDYQEVIKAYRNQQIQRAGQVEAATIGEETKLKLAKPDEDWLAGAKAEAEAAGIPWNPNAFKGKTREEIEKTRERALRPFDGDKYVESQAALESRQAAIDEAMYKLSQYESGGLTGNQFATELKALYDDEAGGVLASKNILTLLNAPGGSLGAQVSDSDRKIYEGIGVNLNTTTGANIDALLAVQALTDRTMMKSRLEQAYASTYGSTAGFKKDWAEFNKKNPMLSRDEDGRVVVNPTPEFAEWVAAGKPKSEVPVGTPKATAAEGEQPQDRQAIVSQALAMPEVKAIKDDLAANKITPEEARAKLKALGI
jgi:hypothetical protein